LIKDIKIWQEFEKEWIKSNKMSIESSFRLFDEMKQIAINAGKFPPNDPLEGLDEKVEFIKRLQKVK